MQQSFGSPLEIVAPAASVADIGGAPIRISRLDAWTTPASAAAMEFCFFCLAVPTDDALRPA